MIIKYNQFLNEKLLPSQFRKYVKEFNTERYKDIFQKYKEQYDGDKNAYRIYLPIVTGQNELKDKIEKLLKDNGYVDIDYFNGTCRGENTQNQSKIGKILNRLKEDDLLKKFVEDPIKKAGSDLLVCISRHPYDIAGSDTDRNWTNCMTMSLTKDSPRILKYDTKLDALKNELERVQKELETNKSNEYIKKKQDLESEIKELNININDRKESGINVKYLLQDVKEGSLISYLIKSDDKNINNPIAVLNIKPFVNEKDKNDIILLSDKNPYGNGTIEFMNTVNKWLYDVNKDKKSGIYKLNNKIYNDGVHHVNFTTEEDYNKMKNDILYEIKNKYDIRLLYIGFNKLRKKDKEEVLDELRKYDDPAKLAKIMITLNNYTLLKQEDKEKWINYFKNVTSYEHIQILNECIDYFTKNDYLNILSNKFCQIVCRFLLNKEIISFDDIIHNFDITKFYVESLYELLSGINNNIKKYDLNLIKPLFDKKIVSLHYSKSDKKYYIKINNKNSSNTIFIRNDDSKYWVNTFNK
jgi:hypothetical protein